jgi:hypothetical protein
MFSLDIINAVRESGRLFLQASQPSQTYQYVLLQSAKSGLGERLPLCHEAKFPSHDSIISALMIIKYNEV